jgi:hypothetical protein
MRKTLAVAAALIGLAACGNGEAKPRDLSIRQPTRSYWFIIKADTTPPYANEDVHYTVRVLDKATEQPILNGEGQIYGQLSPGPDGRPRTWDSFVYGPEVGTYHAKLRFAISALTADPDAAWQMGLRFRRDSLSPIETTNWQQQVRPERDIRTP